MSSSRRVLSPEARLLLDLVPAGLDPERLGDAGSPSGREVASGPDWEELHRLLVRERATAALHPIPDRLPVDVPPAWEERLLAAGAVGGFRQKRLLERLGEAVELLGDHGIPVCLLKGAALALTRYPDVLQRPMADLDLLVEAGRRTEAWEVLRDEGWAWDRERYPVDLYELRPHAPPLASPDEPGCFLEVHDGLFVEGHPFRFGPRDLLTGAEAVEVGGVEVRVPRPAPHLAYICIHFAWNHALGRGGWRAFRDVSVLSAAPGFAWSDFAATAEEAGARRPCYWTLRMARNLGRVEVPGEVLERLRPAGLPSPLLEALERHYALVLFPVAGGCPSVALERSLWRAGARPGGWSGDGALPWAHDEGFGHLPRNDADGEPPPRGGMQRMARHLRNTGAWRRYLGSLLTGAGSLRRPSR